MRPVTVSGEPGPRYLPDIAYDANRNVMVLFGGGDPSGTTLYDDTWEFDGTSWRKITASSPAPGAEAMHHGMQVPYVMYQGDLRAELAGEEITQDRVLANFFERTRA